ncbi:hypothetical protein AS032_32705 [Rhodococcus qingshengii]|nr:hypothetical protein AS032_32705 [Rhodococcus qingshengii]
MSTSDSDRSDPQALRTVPAVGNEVPVDSLGADTTARADHRQHRWRIGYSLADLPRSLYSAIDSGRHADSLAPGRSHLDPRCSAQRPTHRVSPTRPHDGGDTIAAVDEAAGTYPGRIA